MINEQKTKGIEPPVEEKKFGKIKKEYQLLKGMKDILPNEQDYWDLLRSKLIEFAQAYGFERLDLPILESTNLFTRSVGEETDIVTKEIYHFKDRDGQDISLRPEFTAAVCRAYLEHGMINLSQPVKVYSLGPIFRYAKPQAGRYRQFNQFNFEILNCTQPIADAEIILLAYSFCSDLGLKVNVQVNSIGCRECRPIYLQKLTNFYKHRRNSLCPDCKRRYQKNILRLLDCKEKSCSEIVLDAPQIVDSLCQACHQHFIKVLEYLDETEVKYQLNPRLVRGLDYYSRTTFEIYQEGNEEAKLNSLGGGGRYDYLIEELGGTRTGALGFALGVERIINQLKEEKIAPAKIARIDIFIAQLGEAARRKALCLLEDLRRARLRVSEAFTKENLRTQLEVANKVGARYALVLGQKEILDGTIIIRDMENGIQEVVDYKKIIKEITKRLERAQEVSKKLRGIKKINR